MIVQVPLGNLRGLARCIGLVAILAEMLHNRGWAGRHLTWEIVHQINRVLAKILCAVSAT